MESVLNNYELIYKIWSFLDVPTIGSLAGVSKITYRLYKEMYDRRLLTEYIEPCRLRFGLFKEHVALYNSNNLLFDHDYGNNNEIHQRCIRDTKDFVKFLLKDNNWISLVNDLKMMESIFYYLVHVFQILYHFNKHLNEFTMDSKLKYTELLETTNLLKKYLYIEYPEKYNVSELRMFAKFKDTKHLYKKKRLQLVRILTRPENETYTLS